MIKVVFSNKILALVGVLSFFITSCTTYNHNVYESDGVYYEPTSANSNEGYFEYEVDADNSNDEQYLSNIQLNNGAATWGVNEGTEVVVHNNYYNNNWGFSPYNNFYNPYSFYNPYWGFNNGFGPRFSFNVGWGYGFYNNYWLGNPWNYGFYNNPYYGFYGNPYYGYNAYCPSSFYGNGFYGGGYYGRYYDTYGRRSTNLTRVDNNTLGRAAAGNINSEVVSSRNKSIISTVPTRNTIRTSAEAQSTLDNATPRRTSVRNNQTISGSAPTEISTPRNRNQNSTVTPNSTTDNPRRTRINNNTSNSPTRVTTPSRTRVTSPTRSTTSPRVTTPRVTSPNRSSGSVRPSTPSRSASPAPSSGSRRR